MMKQDLDKEQMTNHMNSRRAKHKRFNDFDLFVIEKHKSRIVEDLGLKTVPPILYGDEAKRFVIANVAGYKRKKLKDIKQNGMFILGDGLQEENNTGVVCIFNSERSIDVLAHELCHAKQYQDGTLKQKNSWIADKVDFVMYRLTYAFRHEEKEAFNFAESYLKKAHLRSELNKHRSIRKIACVNTCMNLVALVLCVWVAIEVGLRLDNFLH